MTEVVPQEKDTGKWGRALIGLGVATAINHFGDRLLGVTIEVFTNALDYFSFRWMLDVFLVPLIANFFLALIFGKGSKWLCYATPVIVRGISYFNVAEISGIPEYGHLIPLGWWGFFIILAMETGMVGAVIGESVIKRHYGRKTIEGIYQERLAREERQRQRARKSRE